MYIKYWKKHCGVGDWNKQNLIIKLDGTGRKWTRRVQSVDRISKLTAKIYTRVCVCVCICTCIYVDVFVDKRGVGGV